jgi:hypothetical protein
MKTEINGGLAGWPGLRRILAIAPWFALSACGGGGGGEPIVSQGSAIVIPDPRTALQGFYQASALASPQEFISLVLPTSASSVEWYGWYFKSPSANADPYLFSGVLDLGVNGAAQSNAAGIKAFTSNILATGSVNLSNASLTGFHASVPAVAQQLTALDFDASAAPALNYQFDAPALAADLAGRWTGPWSSGGSIYASTLTFANAGGLVSNTTNFPCAVSQLSLVPRATGNAFTASLFIPAATNCRWSTPTPKTLHGIAFIHTLAGGSRRLEVMLLDSDGSGISFRGDSP